MSNSYVGNIEEVTEKNETFRTVLNTTDRTQLVVMTIAPGDDIGMETHADHDQFIRVEVGKGRAMLDGVEHDLEDGSAVVIAAGTKHNIVNVSDTEPLKLYTIYAPPEHADGTVHQTKEEAETAGR